MSDDLQVQNLRHKRQHNEQAQRCSQVNAPVHQVDTPVRADFCAQCCHGRHTACAQGRAAVIQKALYLWRTAFMVAKNSGHSNMLLAAGAQNVQCCGGTPVMPRTHKVKNSSSNR